MRISDWSSDVCSSDLRIGGKSRMPGSRGLRPWDRRFQAPLKRTRAGFVYSDCVVDDSRLTLLNAMDAAQRGADIRPRTELISARREGNIWHAELSNGVNAKDRVLAHAAGPWVTETLDGIGAGGKREDEGPGGKGGCGKG